MAQLEPADTLPPTDVAPAQIEAAVDTALENPWLPRGPAKTGPSRDDPDCPPGSLFSQPPDLSIGGTAGGSDDNIGWSIIDDFYGITESICDIHWWGINVYSDWTECNKTPETFRITFYDDNGLGEPDLVNPACGPYTITPTKANAGTWHGYTLWYYSAVLSPCCSMTSGWVEIVSLDDGTGCWFLWVTSSTGASWNRNLGDDSLLAASYDMSLCLTGHCIAPGDDCWSTQCGGTYADFRANAIPAGFFGPGSDPFDGRIDLGGGGGLIDTIVERKGWLCFSEPLPSTATVEVELVALDLVSCAPITVTYGGGSPVQWDVQVGLSGVQDPGSMDVTKTHANGGYFDAAFYVQPLYTFTRTVSPYDSVVFDPAAYGIPPILIDMVDNGPWSTDERHEVCTTEGFAAGVSLNLDTDEPCCPVTCHPQPGGGHEHCTEVPDCPECPECEALPDKSACKRVICPDPTEECKPWRIQSPPLIPGSRAEGDPFPPAGTDTIEGTSGTIQIQVMPDNIYELLPETWYFEITEGPPNVTVVQRFEPTCSPYCIIDMQMTQLELVASDGVFDMTVRLNPTYTSIGLVEEPTIGEPGDFPAESFFDVYVDIELPDVTGAILHNQTPIHIEANDIVDLPPWGDTYQVPSGWLGAELYDGTIPTGLWIVWVDHGVPPPPWWQIVECKCLEDDEIHVEHDPIGGVVWCEGICPPGYQPRLYSVLNPDGSTDYWCQCDCACGDIDHSGGAVSLADFATFAVCYGLSGEYWPGCDIEAFTCSDMDGNGTVNLNDFATFATWYGLVSSQTVPLCDMPR